MMKYLVALIAVVMLTMTGMGASSFGVSLLSEGMSNTGVAANVQMTSDGTGYVVTLFSSEMFALGAGIGGVAAMMVQDNSGTSFVGYPIDAHHGMLITITPLDAKVMASLLNTNDTDGFAQYVLGLTVTDVNF